MREIKFRVITDAGIFHAPSDSFSVTFHDTGIEVLMWSSDGVVDAFPAKSVDQWTGLKDKNGVEIYDGDILKFDVRASFEEDSRPQDGCIGKVNIGSRETSFGCWGSAYCHNLFVIGNIHQNPDLLKAD